MRVLDICGSAFTILILRGIWDILWPWIARLAYEAGRMDGESFFGFCVRTYGGVWRLRKFLGLGWWYGSILHMVVRRIIGVVLVIAGVSGFFALGYLWGTEYRALLLMEV